MQKKITSVVALGLSAALLFGSTFAWQSLNQEALNYVRGGANPGGRLHDDFNNITDEVGAEVKTYNKDVYVENFTSAADDGVEIFARIRLEEFMAFGTGAGHGSKMGDPGITSVLETTIFQPENHKSPFRDYWELSWDEGGSTVYMPTFNKNKDSLMADINGTSDENFADYTKYALSEDKGKTSRDAYVIQDKDENDVDELESAAELKDLIANGMGSRYYADYENNIRVSSEKITHQAKKTLTATGSMSVDEWLEMVKDDGGYDEEEHGACWVYDTDGWFYWTAAIQPGTATGLLLDGINRTSRAIDGSWYYELNVVAQFITADDIGSQDANDGLGSGFYDSTRGAVPTQSALELLDAIGVDVNGKSGASATAVMSMPAATVTAESVAVGGESELRQALNSGAEKITLTDDIKLSAPLTVEESSVVYLNGCSIAPGDHFSGQALFVTGNGAWLDFDGKGSVRAPEDGYAVRVRDGGLLYIWGGTFIGGESAVYVEDGEAVIVDGTFYLLDDDEGEVLEWSGKSEIVVYGGTFYNFNPSSAHGRNLLEDGYTVEVEHNDGDTVYTVVFDTVSGQPAETPVLPDTDITVGENPGDVLPDSGNTEIGNAEGGNTETDGTLSGAEDDRDKTGGASADGSGDTAPAPDSSVIESTDSGSISGISGKADVVEPAEPDDGGTAENPAGDAAQDTVADA